MANINFETTEENRKRFNSVIGLKGLKTKAVMNTFVEKFISNSDEVLKFLDINVA